MSRIFPLRGERPYALPPRSRSHTPGRFLRTILWVVLIHVVMQVFSRNIIAPYVSTLGGKLWCVAGGIVLGHVFATAMLATRHKHLVHGTLWGAFGFRKIGLRLVLKVTALAFAFAGFAAFVLSIAESYLIEGQPPIPILTIPPLIIAAIALTVPFFEEVLFRGYLQPYFARYTNKGIAVILTTVIFVSLHGEQVGWYAPALLLVTGLSLILGVLRFRYASLWVCVLFHQVYNAIIAGLTVLASFNAPPHPVEVHDNPRVLIDYQVKQAREASNSLLDNLARAATVSTTTVESNTPRP